MTNQDHIDCLVAVPTQVIRQGYSPFDLANLYFFNGPCPRSAAGTERLIAEFGEPVLTFCMLDRQSNTQEEERFSPLQGILISVVLGLALYALAFMAFL